MTEQLCPDCGSPRPDFLKVCPACGAPPEPEHRQEDAPAGVRAADLEPYITLRYIARLFKVLAVLPSGVEVPPFGRSGKGPAEHGRG